jgi:hypothetical protein
MLFCPFSPCIFYISFLVLLILSTRTSYCPVIHPPVPGGPLQGLLPLTSLSLACSFPSCWPGCGTPPLLASGPSPDPDPTPFWSSQGSALTGSFLYLKLISRAQLTHLPHDGGSKDLWDIGKLLPDYTALQPRRQPSSYSPPWEPQILLSGLSYYHWLGYWWDLSLLCSQSHWVTKV